MIDRSARKDFWLCVAATAYIGNIVVWVVVAMFYIWGVVLGGNW